MTVERKLIGAIVAAMGLVIIAIAFATSVSVTGGGGGMGGGGSTSQYYNATNLALGIIGAIMLGGGMVFGFMPARERVEYIRTAVPTPKPESHTEGSTPEVKPVNAPSAPIAPEVASKEELVLRLLTGDERIMFKAIIDSGGEALQKQLIERTKMSNAKASRVIDRLEERGLIAKERYGSTNRVRIILEK